MIDTSSSGNFSSQGKPTSEELKRDEVMEYCIMALSELNSNEQAGQPKVHRDTVQTLLKVVSNLIANPLEPKVRRMPKSNQAVQAKILQFRSACNFLSYVRKSSDEEGRLDLT